MGPGMFGDPAQDCNCRCVVLSVPRWDIEDKVTKYDNENENLIEVKNYADWKQGYFRRVTDEELMNNLNKNELRKLAKDYEIKGYLKLAKATLVKAILDKIMKEEK